MRTVLFALILLPFALAPPPSFAQEDRLDLPGPIAFAGVSYGLAAVAEPQPGYLRQEYLPAGETLDRFRSMILVEFLRGETTPADLVRAQIAMLEARRGTDPIVNYDVLLSDSDNEIILDFLLSGETAAREGIAEWNAYRYRAGAGPQGERGGWLIGISRRGYGDEVTSFLQGLSATRDADIAALAALPR